MKKISLLSKICITLVCLLSMTLQAQIITPNPITITQANIDSMNKYMYLLSPSAKFSTKFINDYLEMQQAGGMRVSPPGFQSPAPCCNDICITGYFTQPAPSGWCGTDVPPIYVPNLQDPFGNTIWFQGQYGTDERQKYDVYYPATRTASSPIVVLIHGGGWISGPNMNTVKGFFLQFAPEGSSESLVKDLLNQGYVVVSLTYRLAKYGKNATEIPQNDITITQQVNDIDAAIQHIHTNFYSCLGLTANSIQVIGESAGGHLALMWAYTKADMSYIKSVVSYYAPTNLGQYADYLKNRKFPYTNNQGVTTIIDIPSYICSSSKYNCILLCDVKRPIQSLPFFPFDFGFNYNDPFSDQASISTFDCNMSNQDYTLFAARCTLSPNDPRVCNPDLKVIETYKAVYSAIAKNVTTPLTDVDLRNNSPYYALNSTKIVPTFIMHGEGWADDLVPYVKATDGMETKLSSTGGLIATITSSTTNQSVPTDYSGYTQKHLLKTYAGANHGFGGYDLSTIRANTINWLNGHKN